MSTLDDAAPRIGYVGGSLVGQVKVGRLFDVRVCVYRNLLVRPGHRE